MLVTAKRTQQEDKKLEDHKKTAISNEMTVFYMAETAYFFNVFSNS